MTVLVERRDGVATLTLNRPEARNALNLAMCDALMSAAQGLDDAVRLVFVRGRGPVFCAGADLKERQGMSEAQVRERRMKAFAAYAVLESLPMPAIAVVEGAAVGSGCEIAAACDFIVATPQASLEAAAAIARDAGVTPVILGDSIEGESRDVGLVHAGIARQCAMRGQPMEPPCVLISGGETTITLKGDGKGGPNTEFLLALAIALDGMENIYALAGDTDGVDGSEDNAGALIYPDTLKRAEAAGISAKAMLANNDPYTFFKGIGDLLETGPTMTNVNDLRLVYIENR